MPHPLSNEGAELASVVATLEDLRRRLAAMAERLAGLPQPREDAVASLYEAERSVLGSVRSVAKARRLLQ